MKYICQFRLNNTAVTDNTKISVTHNKAVFLSEVICPSQIVSDSVSCCLTPNTQAYRGALF